MAKALAVAGSSVIGNLFCGIAAYYAVATYYGWNNPATNTTASSDAGSRVMAALSSGGHPFLILAALLVVGLALSVPSWVAVGRLFRPVRDDGGAVSPGSTSKAEPEHKEIVNQTFERCDIPLDGYKYFGCTFTDVTFVYNNGDAGGFDHTCRIGGNIGFKSDDPHIQTMLGFLGALRLLRPDLQEKYTAKLGVPNPMSGTLAISKPDDLSSYWSRIVNGWRGCGEKFANLKIAYEYVQNFWDEHSKNKSDPQMKRIERMFPADTLSIDDIVPMQKQMIADAVELRNALIDFSSLLGFRFDQ